MRNDRSRCRLGVAGPIPPFVVHLPCPSSLGGGAVAGNRRDRVELPYNPSTASEHAKPCPRSPPCSRGRRHIEVEELLLLLPCGCAPESAGSANSHCAGSTACFTRRTLRSEAAWCGVLVLARRCLCLSQPKPLGGHCAAWSRGLRAAPALPALECRSQPRVWLSTIYRVVSILISFPVVHVYVLRYGVYPMVPWQRAVCRFAHSRRRG